jgi:predicted nucleic acid-binding protein
MDDSVMVDACIFIDYFRSSGKRKAYFTDLLERYEQCCVSAVAKYEVLCGASDKDIAFWDSTFQQIKVLPFDDSTIMSAREIRNQLKRENKLIDLGDILIAATAIAHDLPLATFNRNHFERIRDLRLV